MDDSAGTSTERSSQVGPGEPAVLKREIASLLRGRIDSMADDVLRMIEDSVPEFKDLPADVTADILRSLRRCGTLLAECFESDRVPEKEIRNTGAGIGEYEAGQGMAISTLIEVLDAGETYVWDLLTKELLPWGFSASSWLEAGRIRDRFTRMLRSSIGAAYLAQQRATSAKQFTEFRAISSLGQTIVSTTDLESVLRQILEVATSLMQVRMGSIVLLDSTGAFLETVVDTGLLRSRVQRQRTPVSASVSGVAIQRNEYVLAQGDELDGFELPRASAGRKVRSVLSVPITVDDEPIGAIELYDTTARSYTEMDVTMLLSFGPQAGVAIKNARLLNEEKKRRRQASTLAEIAQEVSKARDFDELLETITEKTASALDVERCSLFFYDEEAKALTFMAGHGRSTLQVWLLNQFRVPLPELGHQTVRSLRTREPVLVEDVEDEMSLEARIFRGSGVKSYLQVPLAVKEELIGLMSLERTKSEQRFTEDEMTFARALANQAAVAIQNRRLQERLFEQQVAVRNAEIYERLYREREKSEAVLRATPDAVFVVDSDMKIILTNPAAEFLTGWSLSEARGRSCHEVLYGTEGPRGECPRPECPVRRVLEGEHVAYSEDELVTRSGRRIPSGGSFAPIYGPDGSIENVIAIYRDISEQKELEKLALMQKELEIASGIQTSLLPRKNLLSGGVSVHARQQQAKTIGGDWYDYWSEGGRVFLVIGDASGTGVGAALFATMAMSSLRVEAREHEDISLILEHVNRGLYLANRTESFVTVFFAVIDLGNMTMRYANAGHEQPLCIGAESKEPEPLYSRKRSLLGIFSKADLDVNSRALNSGERLILYTDGVIDAHNRRGRLYGIKRLNAFVSANRQLSAPDFTGALINNVLDYSGGEIRDDITVVVCDIP